MLASLSFELLELRKHTATWVRGLILVLFAVVINNYVFNCTSIPAEQPKAFQRLYPKNVPYVAISSFGDLGATIALILGAMAAGNEYAENTLKTVLTQRPRRIAYLVGKLLGVAVILAVFTAAAFVSGAVCSYVVAILHGSAGSLQGPPVREVLGGLGAGWLILTCFGSLGFSLAVLFRSTAAALGVGLGYFVGVETTLAVIAANSSISGPSSNTCPARTPPTSSTLWGRRFTCSSTNPSPPVTPQQCL